MAAEATPTITALLRSVAEGDRAALDSVYAAVYPELRRVARARLYGQGRSGQLGTTSLVHEAFMRLVQTQALSFDDRRHFLAYTARIMRSVIVDEARAVLAERRGGGAEHVTLSGADAEGVATSGSQELLAVHEALLALEQIDPELARLVDLRYFGGYEDAEIAELLGITDRTVRRRWDKARAWLLMALGGSSSA